MAFPARVPEPCEPPAELLPALGLTSAVAVLKSRDYLVVADSAEQVRALSPDIGLLAQIEMGIGSAIVTAPGHGNVDYVARFFAPSVGIAEDPATGSIQCSLAPYWAARLGKRQLQASDRLLASRRSIPPPSTSTIKGRGLHWLGPVRASHSIMRER